MLQSMLSALEGRKTNKQIKLWSTTNFQLSTGYSRTAEEHKHRIAPKTKSFSSENYIDEDLLILLNVLANKYIRAGERFVPS